MRKSTEKTKKDLLNTIQEQDTKKSLFARLLSSVNKGMLKDSLIQVAFISFAVVFTVFIAQISLSEQYIGYYESKMEAKAESLVRNSALLFIENSEICNAEGIGYVLDMVFPSDESDDLVTISYALFEPDGRISASNHSGALELPEAALYAVFREHSTYTYSESPFVRSFYPMEIEGSIRFILMVQMDDTLFLEYGEELSENLYSSLFRGCLMMAGGYLLFSFISSVRKKKKADTPEDEEVFDDEKPPEDPEKRKESRMRLLVQLISLIFCAARAVPAYWFFSNSGGNIRTLALSMLVLFLATGALH